MTHPGGGSGTGPGGDGGTSPKFLLPGARTPLNAFIDCCREAARAALAIAELTLSIGKGRADL